MAFGLNAQRPTERPHLGAACLAEDVPETQRLVAGSRNDGLPIWRHSLGTEKRINGV